MNWCFSEIININTHVPFTHTQSHVRIHTHIHTMFASLRMIKHYEFNFIFGYSKNVILLINKKEIILWMILLALWAIFYILFLSLSRLFAYVLNLSHLLRSDYQCKKNKFFSRWRSRTALLDFSSLLHWNLVLNCPYLVSSLYKQSFFNSCHKCSIG